MNNFYKDFKQFCGSYSDGIIDAYNRGLVTMEEALATLLDNKRNAVNNRIFRADRFWNDKDWRWEVECFGRDGNQIGEAISETEYGDETVKYLQKKVRKTASEMESLGTYHVWFYGSQESHDRAIRKDYDGRCFVIWYGNLIEVKQIMGSSTYVTVEPY